MVKITDKDIFNASFPQQSGGRADRDESAQTLWAVPHLHSAAKRSSRSSMNICGPCSLAGKPGISRICGL